jgi:hypothetical protein
MKQDLLRQAEYAYNFDRMVYFNRKAKKAFSVEFVEDHDEDELKRLIREGAETQGWQFYFNSAPAEAVKRELERALA